MHVHQDYFPQTEKDHLWVPKAAKEGWPIISEDLKISRHIIEVEAVMTSGGAMFCMSGAHYSAEDQARNFLRCLPTVLRTLANTARPFIAKIYQPNQDDPNDRHTTKVRVVLTLPQWERMQQEAIERGERRRNR